MHPSKISILILFGCALGILLMNSHQPGQANLRPAESGLPLIDDFIAGEMRELEIPGLALAVVRSGEVLALRGYGKADESDRPVTPQTPFLAASLSKSITALGVMQLVEAGKLELDLPVQNILPWFHTADPSASAQITVRHLLHHTSGFSEFEGDLRNLEADRGEQALETSLRRLGSSRLNAVPGKQFEYSNTNYDLLGLLIQKISGKPYETYIQEEIFAPLGMKHSYTSLEEARRNGLASGYIPFFGLTLPYDGRMPYSQTVVPSAGLFLSAEDLARYLIFQLNQGRLPGGAQLLSPAGIAQIHAPGVQIGGNVHYAMGWTQFPFEKAAPADGSGASIPLALAHGGDWANYKALMVLIPKQSLGVVILMNKQDWRHASAYEQIGWNTALLALGLPPAKFPVNEDFMTRYGRIFGVTLVLLLSASLVWSVQQLVRGSGWGRQDPQRRRWMRTFLIFLPLLDLALAGYILLFELESLADLRLSLAFFPEVGLLYLLLLGLTIGWGFLRSVFAIRKLFGNRRVAAPGF